MPIDGPWESGQPDHPDKPEQPETPDTAVDADRPPTTPVEPPTDELAAGRSDRKPNTPQNKPRADWAEPPTDEPEPKEPENDSDRPIGGLAREVTPAVASDVPRILAILDDGQRAVIIGHPDDLAIGASEQGQNTQGIANDCGVVSSVNVLHEFGHEVTEQQAIDYAITNGKIEFDPQDPFASGGTTYLDRQSILLQFGEPSSIQQVNSLADIRRPIEEGRGEILRVNADDLWQTEYPLDPNNAGFNHAIQVTGVAIDPATDAVIGFYINDSGTGESKKFVGAAIMEEAAIRPGFQNVANVTDRKWTERS